MEKSIGLDFMRLIGESMGRPKEKTEQAAKEFIKRHGGAEKVVAKAKKENLDLTKETA